MKPEDLQKLNYFKFLTPQSESQQNKFEQIQKNIIKLPYYHFSYKRFCDQCMTVFADNKIDQVVQDIFIQQIYLNKPKNEACIYILPRINCFSKLVQLTISINHHQLIQRKFIINRIHSVYQCAQASSTLAWQKFYLNIFQELNKITNIQSFVKFNFNRLDNINLKDNPIQNMVSFRQSIYRAQIKNLKKLDASHKQYHRSSLDEIFVRDISLLLKTNCKLVQEHKILNQFMIPRISKKWNILRKVRLTKPHYFQDHQSQERN